jgi:aerobic C4-dicarboxylate transport protein
MKYLRILYVQVIIGIVAGVLAGWLFPAFAPTAKLISDMFINMIKMIIAPIIFFTIVLGICSAGEMKKVGRIGLKSIIYFEIVSSFSLVIGLIVAGLLKPGSGVQYHQAAASQAAGSQAIGSQVASFSKEAEHMNWGDFVSHIIPSNIVDAFAKGDILQLLFISILFGIGLKWLGREGDGLLVNFNKINKVFFNILNIVVKLSPVGAFGGMAYTIGKFGFATLLVLGKLLACFYLTGILFIFIVLNIICRLYKISLWKLLGYIKEELLIVLSSSSSEAALPLVIKKLTDAGCQKEVVGLVIPAGYSFNLDGTTIYLSMSVIFLAQVFNVPLSLGQEITLIGILMLTSKGAAGVTGSGFIVLASTLTALKVIPLEGLALLIGVDRFMSEGRAVINFIGNAVATVVIAKSENELDMGIYKNVVEHASIPKTPGVARSKVA